jgi:hypothetical protein
VVVGSVGEVGNHLRAQATLLEGSTGPEEHWRRRSTVTGEAEEAVAGDELAPGLEVLSVSSSGVLRGEGKVGVWFTGSDDDGWSGRVAMASSSGSKRAEVSGEETKGNSAPVWQLRRG